MSTWETKTSSNPIMKIERENLNTTIFLNKLSLYQCRIKKDKCPKTGDVVNENHLVLLFDSGKELSFKDNDSSLFNALEAHFNSSV